MDDLQDGVSKLAEFSTVLSSVTRTLDKNVRRLESEFGKCNTAFKEIKVLVEEQTVHVNHLRDESDQQKACLVNAVAANAEAGKPIQPSKYLSNELDAVIRIGESSPFLTNGDAWSKVKQVSDTPVRISINQAVNDAVHILNKTLTDEYRKMADKSALPNYSKRIGKSSTPAKAIGALIQRMYEAENAIAMQSAINEAVVKALKDDTYIKNSHNHLAALCTNLTEEIKSMKDDQLQLRKTMEGMQLGIDTLQASFEKHKAATEDVAKGGKLRIERRRKRLTQFDDDPDVAEEEFVDWGLDAFTLEESDEMLKKVLMLEKRVFGPSGLEPRVAGLDLSVEELTGDLVVMKEQQQEMKEWQEENSNSMLKKVAALRITWDGVLGDINFGLNQFSNEHGGKNEDAPFIEKLGNLYDSIENSLRHYDTNKQLEETLDALCPLLDNITAQAEVLFELDKVAAATAGGKDTNGEDLISFANIFSLNRQDLSLKHALQKACTESISIIDERIPKIHMRRRLDAIEKSGARKDDIDRLKGALKKSRAESKELVKEVQKKASLEDLKKLREGLRSGGFEMLGSPGALQCSPAFVHEEASMDSLGDSIEEKWEEASFAGDRRESLSRSGGKAGISRVGSMMVDGASAGALADVGVRLDLLVRQFKDLQDAQQSLVPREEVHEAMSHMLHEIKLVKLNSINVNRFKIGMDTKADADEVRRLVETLNTAVGDMMGTNVTAAGKARCLLCDKPVGTVVKDAEKRDKRGVGNRELRGASPERPSPSVILHGDVATLPGEESYASRPSSVPKLASSSSLSKLHHEKAAKITTELTVLRNSIDLPLVDPVMSSPNNPKLPKDTYKQRIRGSGAGGFGTN